MGITLDTSRSEWHKFAAVLGRSRVQLFLLMSSATGVLALRIGPHPVLVADVLVLGVLGPVLGVLDTSLHRLPDRIVLPMIPLAILVLVTVAAIDHDAARLGRALLGSVLVSTGFTVLALLARGDLGWGDVKVAGGLLAPPLAWAGWWTLLDGELFAFAAAAVAAHTSLVPADLRGRRRIALGPYLFGGALAAVLISGYRSR